MECASQYPDDAPPPTPLSKNPALAAERQQVINAQFMGRFTEPDLQSRPVSPLSDPRNEDKYEDAPRHTSRAPRMSSDDDIGRSSTFKGRMHLGKNPPSKCALCEARAHDAKGRKQAEKQAAGNTITDFLRPRAKSTLTGVEKMETIMSRQPSQVDLADLTNEIELTEIKPKSGRPKAMTTVSKSNISTLANLYGNFTSECTEAGPSNFKQKQVQTDVPSVDTSQLSRDLDTNGRYSPDRSRLKPCQQLPLLENCPPSRSLTPDTKATSHFDPDAASTMAVKSRPLSAIEDYSPAVSANEGSELHAPITQAQGNPVMTIIHEDNTNDGISSREQRSSGSEEEEATGRGTGDGSSAWATRQDETQGTTPEDEANGESDDEGLEMGGSVKLRGERMGMRLGSGGGLGLDLRELEQKLREVRR